LPVAIRSNISRISIRCEETNLKETLELHKSALSRPIPGASETPRNPEIDELFASCMPTLRKTAERLLRNREDSEDVLQDALLLGFRNIHQFQCRAKFSTWMHTILRNSARSMWRKQQCRPIHSTLDFETGEEEQSRSFDDIASNGLNPEEEYLRGESLHVVAELLEEIPSKYRDVVWLCKINELKVTEAAEKLGVQVGTIKVRMHRARRMIANSLDGRINTMKYSH
jgi:RNA polymerase sigma-70 factor, ECF subfamily